MHVADARHHLCRAFVCVACYLRFHDILDSARNIMTEARHPPILVVDDNHDNADIIRQYLEAHGYPITVAYDGDEALTQFELVRPSLVLLDVMMPGRDGWE